MSSITLNLTKSEVDALLWVLRAKSEKHDHGALYYLHATAEYCEAADGFRLHRWLQPILPPGLYGIEFPGDSMNGNTIILHTAPLGLVFPDGGRVIPGGVGAETLPGAELLAALYAQAPHCAGAQLRYIKLPGMETSVMLNIHHAYFACSLTYLIEALLYLADATVHFYTGRSALKVTAPTAVAAIMPVYAGDLGRYFIKT